MKSSSTLHRSNISKERIKALEELLSNSPKPYDSSPGVYVRSDKDRELDVLWQGFKINSKEERSPGVYLSIGFVTGAICMFLMITILNFGNPSKEGFADLSLWKRGNTEVKKDAASITVTPASQADSDISGKTEKYQIQEGDTLEKIALRFYGASTPERIQKIQIVNNLKSPHQIRAGDQLNIPVQN